MFISQGDLLLKLSSMASVGERQHNSMWLPELTTIVKKDCAAEMIYANTNKILVNIIIIFYNEMNKYQQDSVTTNPS